MKKVLIPALAFAFTTAAAFAEETPLWMRYCALSPDGQTIAFSYQGDLFTVPTAGGEARQLTSHPGQDTRPVWSPDGKQIAFASDREGQFDIYLIDKQGGEPKRLTTHTAAEYPVAFRDNNHVLYNANVMQDATDIQFPGARFMQVYEVDTEGHRPQLYSSLYMDHLAVSPDGKQLLYNDWKGYEDSWRKHHQSSITRDIWLADSGQKQFRKLTTFGGEDRNPVWAPDGQSYYYLSEQNGSFNVYKASLNGGQPKQLTQHTLHPVRHLTASQQGLLCYDYDGEIYTLREGEQPKKVNIRIRKDNSSRDLVQRLLREGATDIAVSPSAKEVAFITHGDVYVTSVEYETTRQITDTPQQERNIEFSPDGRSLLYSAEREGTWGLYESKLKNKEDKLFTYAPEIQEEPLVVNGKTSFQPTYSPDGKEVAYLEERTTLKVVNRATKQIRTVLDGKYLYSYSDGDQHYQWSPDSRWLLVDYISVGGWNNSDVALVKADGSGEVTNLTESGYSDGNAKWVLDGKAMIWNSDRAGYRSHGSWGAERDIYIMFFDGEAYDKFRLSKEETALLEDDEQKDKKDDKEADKKEEKADKPVEPLKFDLANRQDRVIRLTAHSSHLGDAVLSQKGDKLYYCATFEKGYDLWEQDLKERSTKLLLKEVGGGTLLTDKKVENLFLTSRGKLKKIELKDNKEKNIPFQAEFNYRPAEERAYIFEHAWRQAKEKFYDPTLRGIDWEGYRKAYARFLPHINNNYDFQEMLSELLGELNGSHTGARYYAPMNCPETASLGAFFDNAYSGEGLKIEEILAKGPLTKADTKIRKGCVIEAIDGVKLTKENDYYPLLSGKAYQRFEPRGQYIGSDPYNKWTKPSCVLMCEDNYSNAHGFPWVYKELNIGKLIGAPVPGTMTAVWWETQIDNTLVFGIPQVGVKDMRGNYLENQQLQPDIEVYNTPEQQLSGEDAQLRRAVEEMLKTVK